MQPTLPKLDRRLEALPGWRAPMVGVTVPAAWVPAARLLAALALAALVGCASPVRRDGPPAGPSERWLAVPDAQPRLERVRPGGPNKPYAAMGGTQIPLQGDPPLREVGLASWYGSAYHGRPTALGEPYDMYAMSAAHRTMPLPSYARVRNPANGRSVVVRVNDRGPFVPDRIIDLSYTAALKLDLLRGVGRVEVERIRYEDIAAGRVPLPPSR